jgi:hypothetical protein
MMEEDEEDYEDVDEDEDEDQFEDEVCMSWEISPLFDEAHWLIGFGV